MRTVAVALAVLGSTQGPPQDLTEANFPEWHSFIIPKAQELAWREIPWRPTFWEAAVEAQAQDRPILLWAMNGHPLACT